MNLIHWLFPTYSNRQLLALAGVIQSASLVDSLAQAGTSDSKAFKRCLLALLETSPDKDEDVFGANDELQIGVKELLDFCSGHNRSQQVTRYAIQMLHLQKLLGKKPGIQKTIQSGLAQAGKQQQLYGSENDNLIRSLASLYQDTIGTLGFRIQVTGNQQFLQQDMIAARIRTLLFAGVRFAFLWRQSGGHAHHLVTAKRQISHCARNLAT